ANFRPVTVTSCFGKLVNGCLAALIFSHIAKHNLLDTTVQKGFVKHVSGCADHTGLLDAAFRLSRRSKRNLRVLQIDLKAAFTGISHKLIADTLKAFRVHDSVCGYVAQLYASTSLYIRTPEFSTDSVRVQRGVLQGDTLSPLLFIMCFSPVLDALRDSALAGDTARPRGADSTRRYFKLDGKRGRHKLHTLGYADDLTLVTQTHNAMLKQVQIMKGVLDDLGMVVNAKKCRYLALPGGKPSTADELTIDDEPVPNALSEGSKFLGMELTYLLDAKLLSTFLRGKLTKWLSNIGSSGYGLGPQKFALDKLVLTRFRWYFSIYQVQRTEVLHLQSIINKHLKRTMNLNRATSPHAVTSPKALATGNLILLWDEVETMEHVRRIRSGDENVRKAAQLREQTDNAGHGTVTFTQRLAKNLRHLDGNDKDHTMDLQPLGVPKTAATISIEQAVRDSVRAVHDAETRTSRAAKAKSGEWWRCQQPRYLRDLDREYQKAIWGMAPKHIGWTAEAISDSLPTPRNLTRWGIRCSQRCAVCHAPIVTLLHILSDCKVALQQQRYTWRHNKVLEEIARGVRASSLTGCRRPTHVWVDLSDGDFDRLPMLLNLSAASSSRPDCIVVTGAKVYIIELTVPHETNIDKAHRYKTAKYRSLPELYAPYVGSRQVELLCVEVGVRGWLANSTLSLKEVMGRREAGRTRRRMVAAAVRASQLLFHVREEPEWGARGEPPPSYLE
ncbi:MAG: reverse transcriptase domain-containing protein, partial [Acidobacteriota bacterium]|nr:reverse transcriptase domain-containing protein [Acidobacteriota bacterium]